MDNTNKLNTNEECNNSQDNSNEKQSNKKPFLITKDVIDDCLSTSMDS